MTDRERIAAEIAARGMGPATPDLLNAIELLAAVLSQGCLIKPRPEVALPEPARFGGCEVALAAAAVLLAATVAASWWF